jgi:hypothetical protein
LRDADVKQQQVQLAKEAGVTAFCLYSLRFRKYKERLIALNA